ncbi:PKD domain-containing protein [Kitasatospora kazusensis]|uniref:PKD domain-containing protein n=1 Tax=Kitasatospora kazusensis TaxID=407974 RepID=UPI0031D3D575
MAAAVTLGAGLPALPAAAAAGAATLYVDRMNRACSDSGTGTYERPYCTVSAAAAVVGPGQTVQIGDAVYQEHVEITRSGTPDRPIVFTGSLPGAHMGRPLIGGDVSAPAITVSGAHDVVIQDLATMSVAEGILVSGSARITIDHDFDQVSLTGSDWFSHTPWVRLTGGTSDTVVSRSDIGGRGTGVTLDPGTHDNTVTTNDLGSTNDAGVMATDAPGTVVTSNTISHNCGTGISLAGASTGSTVENNILAPATTGCSGKGGPTPGAAGLLVSAGSATGTKADYNVVRAAADGTAYSWAGTPYPGPVELAKATGQGQHDSSADPALTGPGGSPDKGSPALDSADAAAPGELDSDLNYVPAVDYPGQPDTGTGSGHRDRGAVENQGITTAALTVDRAQGAYPFKVSVSATAKETWPGATLAYSFDFGDGTAPVVSAVPKADHTYTARGVYEPLVTVTDSAGGLLTTGTVNPVSVGDPGPPQAVLSVSPGRSGWSASAPFTFEADAGLSAGPWPIVSRMVDFGDGSAPVQCAGPGGSLCDHTYARPGSYTVTLTVKDSAGGTSSTSQAVDAAYQPGGFDWKSKRILDTRNGTGGPAQRLGPDSELTLSVAGAVGTDTTAVVLNLTAVNPSSAGFLTAYPSGQARPTTSNSNFTAGQTVAHLVTVPVGSDGKIKIYNRSGSVDLVADLVGAYAPSESAGFTAVTPTRVLDTRTGTGSPAGKVGPKGGACFTLPDSVPRDSAYAVLNITATGADQPGFLTFDGNWNSSILNVAPGRTVANQSVIEDAQGEICLSNATGHTDIVADLTGYYYGRSGDRFTPVGPSRLLDTRIGSTPLGPDSTLGVQVTGRAGVPADATGAVLSVTATAPDQGGFLTAYPTGGTRPATSSVNFAAGETVPNLVTSGVGTGGGVTLYNHTGRTQAVVDVSGYFSKP